MTEAGDGERPPPEPDAVRLGGVEEFAGLFDTYAAPMHRYLARRVGVDQAHDLVSETFLIAFRRRGTYDPRTAGAKAWLYGIATNLARRHPPPRGGGPGGGGSSRPRPCSRWWPAAPCTPRH